MENANELRKQISEVLTDLRNGDIEHKVAAEFFNGAGKMIASTKVQLEYSGLRKEKPSIPWLAEEG